jgi:hypothetical protein
MLIASRRIRLRDRRAVVAADRATLRGGHRRAGDLREPAARSRPARSTTRPRRRTLSLPARRTRRASPAGRSVRLAGRRPESRAVGGVNVDVGMPAAERPCAPMLGMDRLTTRVAHHDEHRQARRALDAPHDAMDAQAVEQRFCGLRCARPIRRGARWQTVQIARASLGPPTGRHHGARSAPVGGSRAPAPRWQAASAVRSSAQRCPCRLQSSSSSRAHGRRSRQTCMPAFTAGTASRQHEGSVRRRYPPPLSLARSATARKSATDRIRVRLAAGRVSFGVRRVAPRSARRC